MTISSIASLYFSCKTPFACSFFVCYFRQRLVQFSRLPSWLWIPSAYPLIKLWTSQSGGCWCPNDSPSLTGSPGWKSFLRVLRGNWGQLELSKWTGGGLSSLHLRFSSFIR